MKQRISDALHITGIICCGKQQSKLRCERGSWWLIATVEDDRTGHTGRIAVIQEYDKRDVEEERITTDTPALFEDQHPECDWYGTLPISEDKEPNDHDPDLDNELHYGNGPAGWGLYNEAH